MATGVSPALSQGAASTRSVARYRLRVPLALTVLRAGIPNQISGSTFEIGDGGLGVVPAEDLLVGESVRVEFLVPHTSLPVRATAVVRYEHEGGFGLQFLRLPAEQQSMVRYWTRRQGELVWSAAEEEASEVAEDPELPLSFEPSPRGPSMRLMIALAVCLTAISAGLAWWHWQQGWAELEPQAPARDAAAVQPQLNVEPDAMEQRILYRVLPEYPEAARQAGVQGTVVLDTLVNAEGTVAQTKFVSGPDVLARAAEDAVRWWRFKPYSVKGRPAAVETTVTVNFRLTN